MPRIEDLTTPAWFQMRPHPQQSAIWRDTDRFQVAVAGRGSGKTELYRRKLVRLLPVKKPWRDPVYYYGLPTFQQAKRIAWEKVIQLIPPEWLDGPPNRSELLIRTIFGSKLYIVGMDKPMRVEGDQIDGFVLDECSDQKPGTYTKTILPMLQERKGFCARIGVPKRTGVGATEFKKAYDAGLLPNNLGLKSYNWSSYSIRSKEELAEYLGQMTAKDAEEQLGGLWTDQEGQIFYAYSDTHNLDSNCVYDSNLRIGVGSDFNVSPMAWVLFHIKDGFFRVFDEIFVKDTNTEATLNELYNRYPKHKAGWNFYGDPSARARKTSATYTDYAHISNDMRFLDKVIDYDLAHMAVVDRFAATNAVCKNANGVRRLFIHPRCENLRSDLCSRTYKPGTREPLDEKGTDSGHITDALGYAICKTMPFLVAVHQAPKITITGI